MHIPATEPAMRRKKILLADDSKTALMMERTLLARSAYDIISAADGREAVAQAIEEAPDLIILDVVMPYMDGFEACRELRRLEATRAIPIIMVTTRGEPHNVEIGYEVGCNDYVTKPINGPELLSKVRNLIGE
jgi:CheY-like chemotaxis protein